MRRISLIATLSVAAAFGQNIELVEVVAKTVDQTVRLPGELLPYQSVDLRARVAGFIERVEVDRGSVVKKGQLLAVLSAPEMNAQIAEAEAKVRAAESRRAELGAKAVAAESTFQRLKAAAATPGAIAGNELVVAEKALEADRAAVTAAESSVKAAQASLEALRELAGYLRVTAPFDGVITERLTHPGALVGPTTGPLLRLEQNTRLRLVVPVPETDIGILPIGSRISFSLPAYKGELFYGTVARASHSLNPETRAMAVELDVENSRGRLAPGMYPEVLWPVRKGRASLLVPPTAIVTTTERTFVIRDKGGKAEWVNVSRGAPAGELVQVLGPLKPGDRIVRRGSDEIREGTLLSR